MNDCVLYEKFPNFALPVGSIVTQQGKTCLYRDIDKRHIFTKGTYQAISVDDVVIDYLESSGGVDQVVFYLTDTGTTLTTSFNAYKTSKPKRMAGRAQRMVNRAAFTEAKGEQVPRPTQKVFIEVEKKWTWTYPRINESFTA